jgi:hypothetical protein
LAEALVIGPMREEIFSSRTFNQDEVRITMKMLSLMKSRIIEHELFISEYRLRQRGKEEGGVGWVASS